MFSTDGYAFPETFYLGIFNSLSINKTSILDDYSTLWILYNEINALFYAFYSLHLELHISEIDFSFSCCILPSYLLRYF